MKRGKTLTLGSGEILANDLRKRRFGNERQRARRRRPPISSEPRHFKTPSGGIAGMNPTTKQMGSATCREWQSSDTGLLTDSGNDETVYNQHVVPIPGDSYVLAVENEAGLLVVIERPPEALRRVKTKAACAAMNDATGAMSSVSCDLYVIAVGGTVTDSGTDITVFNPGGAIASGKWGTVQINEAGQYEFVVVKCS